MTPYLVMLVLMSVALAAAVKFCDTERQQEAEHLLDRMHSPRAQLLLEEITLVVSENQHILRTWHRRALEHHRAGRRDEALRWIRRGCETIEELAPDFVTALGELRRLARAASLVVALPPVPAVAYRTRSLRGVAGVGAALHHLLVTGRQQMRVRIAVIRAAFHLALRGLRRTVDLLPGRPLLGWAYVNAYVADLDTCGDQGVETARRILSVLDSDEAHFLLATHEDR